MPNKLTASVKDAIVGAFNVLGGQAWLVRVARDDPRTFATLLSKIIPRDVTVSGSLKTTVTTPPTSTDPAVLEAALALDLAISNARSHADSVGPTRPPELPVVQIPPPDPAEPDAAGDGSAPFC